MRNIWIVLIALCGCQSPLDEYIANHTERAVTYGSACKIRVVAESATDIDETKAMLLLEVQRYVRDTVLPDDGGLCSMRLYLPSTFDSWLAVRSNIKDLSNKNAMASIIPRSSTVVYKPTIWRNAPLYDIIETYVHELVHYIALRLDGDMDADHSKFAYWGAGGLAAVLFDELKLKLGF